MLHGETVHSVLPWDIPWWMPDHAVFFGVLYMALGIIGLGVTWVVLKSLQETCSAEKHGAGTH